MPYRAIMQDGGARGICISILSRMEDAVPSLKLAKEQWAAKVLFQQVLRNSISWFRRKVRESSKSNVDAASTVPGALGFAAGRRRTYGGSAINMELTPLKRKSSSQVEEEEEEELLEDEEELEGEVDVQEETERISEENEEEEDERILEYYAEN